jgi:protocatechuate 3,4-dioxygenase beta subunit
MSKIDLSRRQFINATAASVGLFSMTGTPNLVLGEEPADVGLKIALPGRDPKIPYIGLTDDGPFYPPVEIPWLKDFTSVGGVGKQPVGEIMYLFGRILDVKGRPLESATVEIWHADNNGLYKHPRAGNQNRLDPNFSYFGKVKTAKDGTYLFKSIVPHWYSLLGIKRANHVHLKMRHKDHGVQTTQMYFAGKEQDDIRRHDHVFKSHGNGDRLIIPKENPAKYSDLDIEFDDKSVCCRFDLAFFL